MSEFIKTSLEHVLYDPISGSRPKGGVNNEGEIPSLGGENVTMQGGLNLTAVKKITSDFFNSMSRGHLKNLDVLINKDGANTGKSTIYRKSPFLNAAVNEHLFILRGKDGKIDQEYLHYLLQFSSIRAIIEKKITGSAQPGLNSSFVKNFPIELAPLPEQKKIASILTSVDEVIETTQKQIDKLQDLKKATMNELLTQGIGHTEFKDSELGRIPKSWEVKKVGDLAQITKLAGFEYTSHFDYSIGGDIIALRALNLTNGQLDLTNVQTIPTSVSDKLPRSKLFKGDILITYVGVNIGELGHIDENDRYHLAPNIGKISFHRGLIDTNFMFQQLLSERVQNSIKNLTGVTSQPSLNMGNIRQIPVLLTKKSEQKKIREILQSIDARIEVKNHKLAQTQALKKSLMQDLLTGKVRVKVH